MVGSRMAVSEYVGAEVYPTTKEGHLVKKPIQEESGVKIGDILAVLSPVGGFQRGEVRQGESGTLVLDLGESFAPLEYGMDDRGCWLAVGFINRRAIEELGAS